MHVCVSRSTQSLWARAPSHTLALQPVQSEREEKQTALNRFLKPCPLAQRSTSVSTRRKTHWYIDKYLNRTGGREQHTLTHTGIWRRMYAARVCFSMEAHSYHVPWSVSENRSWKTSDRTFVCLSLIRVIENIQTLLQTQMDAAVCHTDVIVLQSKKTKE